MAYAEIKKFIRNAALFLAMNAVIFAALHIATGYAGESTALYLRNWNTESNFSVMPEGKAFDVLIMGASHSRMFSVGGNHHETERILGASVFNISKRAVGPAPEKVYLWYFLEKGNTADTLVYFLDPFTFYSWEWNLSRNFLADEPFKSDIAAYLVAMGFQKEIIAEYARPKVSRDWFLTEPELELSAKRLADFEENKARGREEYFYRDTVDEEEPLRNLARFSDILTMAQDHGTKKIVVIFPPVLWPKDRGRAQLKNLLLEEADSKEFLFYDLSGAVNDPALFFDYDHFNRDGVLYFNEYFLGPILRGEKKDELGRVL